MKRNINIASDNDLSELDKLVTQEINALQQNNKQKSQIRKSQKRKSFPTDNVIFREGWPKESESTEYKEPSSEEHETDRMYHLQDEGLDGNPAIDDSQITLEPTADLFTKEEQDFIQRSTDWLAERENKDMIISRIWEQLTESVPESFYSAQHEGGFRPENLPETASQELDNAGTNPPEPST